MTERIRIENKCEELGLSIIDLSYDCGLFSREDGTPTWVLTIDRPATIHEISGNVNEVLNELNEWGIG